MPGPGLVEAEEVEQGEAVVPLRRLGDALEPGVDAELVEAAVLALQTELVGEEASPARGVDDDPGVQVPLPAIRHRDPNAHRAAVLEDDVLDLGALDDLGSLLVSVSDEQGVHDVTLDVVREGLGSVWDRVLEQPDLHELPRLGARGVPGRPGLVDETAVVQLVEEVDPLEHEVRRGREGLPDVVAGVDVPLDDDGLAAAHREQGAERRPGRPSPDDDDVGVVMAL